MASTLSTAANVYDSTQVPRFTGFNNLPTQLLPPAPKGGFPATYPNIFAITNSIDDNLKAPYSMNLNFSIGREFGHGFFVQGSYVGRLSRHSLMQRDLAMPTNLRDPKSGQTYFQAMSQLATQLDFSGVSGGQSAEDPVLRKSVVHGRGRRIHRHAGGRQGLSGAQQSGRLHERAERYG